MKATILAIHLIVLCLSVCAADGPRLREITTVPKLEKRDDTTRLLIEDGKKRIEIPWSFEFRGEGDREESYQYFPVTLAPDTRYTFTFEEQQYSSLKELEESGVTLSGNIDRKHFMSTRQTLVRISRDGAVLFDRNICEIHDRKMQRIDAPIIYGLLMHRGPYPTLKQRQTQFPHYREVSFGGCMVMPQKTKLMFVCPACKAAHEQWENEHPITTK